MPISARRAGAVVAIAVAAAIGGKGVRPLSAASVQKGSDAVFTLTVDSIMRGSKLVGYPEPGLRWSGDSARLYFEWRGAGEDEASTWVVNRDGGNLRKLTDDERRNAPPANGVWDRAHRRVLFVDQGDIVLVDSVAGTRRSITRTTGAESSPRW